MTSRIVRRTMLLGAAALAMATLTSSIAGGTIVPTRRPRITATVAPTRHPASTPAAVRTKGNVARLISVEELRVTDLRPGPASVDSQRRKRPPRGPGGSPGGCTIPGAGTNEYTVQGWKIGGPRSMHFSASTTPAGLSNVAGSLQAALNAWSSADSRAPQLSVVSDGTTSSPVADHQDEMMFASLGGTTLAVTYTWQWSSGEVESDVALNAAGAWFQAASEGTGCVPIAAYDVQNTLTHEAGHVYGLGHANSSPFNTMYPSATTGETFKRSLAPGDVLGIQHTY
jgi:hypothetical protein